MPACTDARSHAHTLASTDDRARCVACTLVNIERHGQVLGSTAAEKLEDRRGLRSGQFEWRVVISL
jgi:hypothetical protein